MEKSLTSFDQAKAQAYWDQRAKSRPAFIGHRVYTPVSEWRHGVTSEAKTFTRLEVQCVNDGPHGRVSYNQDTQRAQIAIHGDPVLTGRLLHTDRFKETSDEYGEQVDTPLIMLDEWETARYGPQYPLMLETGQGWEGGPPEGVPDRTQPCWKYIDQYNVEPFRHGFPGPITWMDGKCPTLGDTDFSELFPTPEEHDDCPEMRPVGYECTLNCTGTMMLLRARYADGNWDERYTYTVVIDEKRVRNPGLWGGKYGQGTQVPSWLAV